MREEIDSELDYIIALDTLERMIDQQQKNEVAQYEIGALAESIARYERDTVSLPCPCPLEALRFRVEQSGLSQKLFAASINVRPNKLSEIMSGKRKPSLKTIRNLVRVHGMSADVLIMPWPVEIAQIDGK